MTPSAKNTRSNMASSTKKSSKKIKIYEYSNSRKIFDITKKRTEYIYRNHTRIETVKMNDTNERRGNKEKKIKEHKCSECDKIFDTAANRKQHKYWNHTEGGRAKMK